MKRSLLASVTLLFCLVACFPLFTTPEETPTDTTITVTGLPDAPVKAYSEFTLKVNSPSDGYIDFRSSNPALASVGLVGRNPGMSAQNTGHLLHNIRHAEDPNFAACFAACHANPSYTVTKN